MEKQVSRGPLHVLHRKGKLWLLRGRAVGADKGLHDPSSTEEFA